MKRSYKGFEIDAHRGESMSGASLVFYSCFRESDQLEITSGYSYGIVRDEFAMMKHEVDQIMAGEKCAECGLPTDPDEVRPDRMRCFACDESYVVAPSPDPSHG